jgi:hypothetical protein
MTACPIMLDGCRERYSILENILEKELKVKKDTISILTNENTISDNKAKEWKRKAIRRIPIMLGSGFVIGFVVGVLL